MQFDPNFRMSDYVSQGLYSFPTGSTALPMQFGMSDLGAMAMGTNPTLGQALQVGGNNLGSTLGTGLSVDPYSAGINAALGDHLKSMSNPTGSGWGSMGMSDKINSGVNLFNAGFGAWQGYQAQKLAKDQFRFTKDAFNKQYEANKNLTNSQLYDRQAKRVRTDPSGREMSVNEYMQKYGVK